MCIIAVYQKGTRPTKERVERMMALNRDGVGIGYNTGSGVYFHKGFTSAEAVMRFIDKLDFARDIVFHARIATSGGVSAEKCHPYPITTNATRLNVTSYKGSAPVLFHNGILPVSVEAGFNDTQTFIKNALAPLYKADADGVKNGLYDSIISLASRGSRLAILYKDGVALYGDWTEDDGGVMYSNTGYKPFKSYYYYDYDDADCRGTWWEDYNKAHGQRKKNALAMVYGGAKNGK